MAIKQSLIGVCFVGLHTLGADSDEGYVQVGMSENLFFEWMGTAAQINMKNDLVNEQCVELQKRLATDGLRSCILKGQGVAMLYGENLCGFRQSGDIDIWIDASKEKIIDYVMSQSPTKEFDQKHIHFHCFDDTEVEAHRSPSVWENPMHNRIMHDYFESVREYQFGHVSEGIYVPSSNFQLAHQLLHVYRHYVYEGVGLRQMMDLYFAQIACAGCEENSIEYEKLDMVVGLFKNLGLLKFVAATQWVLCEMFGMSESVLLYPPDAKEGRKLLDEIIIGGNFGYYDKRNHVKEMLSVRRFFRRWGRKFRMFRFDPLGTLIMPFSRLQLELWMRHIRRKYND